MRSSARPPFSLSAVLGLGLATALGCGSSGQEQLSLGRDDGGPSYAFSADANNLSALDAYIENGSHIAVKFITLSCAGDCATVEAVGTGGNPPYTFDWDDGSTSATRQVCPTASTSYSVKVTDTGTSGELTRPAQTAQANVTTDVVACPDSGAPDDAAASADAVDAPAPWVGCETASGSDSTCGFLPDSSLLIDWSVPLARPLVAGQSYDVDVQVTTVVPTGNPPEIEVFGTSGNCTNDQGTADLSVGTSSLSLQTLPVTPITGLQASIHFCTTVESNYAELLIGLAYTSGGGGTNGVSVQACAVSSCADF
jgi:hypothetical protein